MMCNAIMTLYDAAVERRAGSVSYKLESAKKKKKNNNIWTWRLKKTQGWSHRASEKSGVKLSTNRSKI